MIIDFNKGTLQQECDTRVVKVAIVLFLFVTWLCTPPGNKFAQVCLYGNFTRHFVANIVNKDSANEYKYYYNNAIYYLQIDQYKYALRELDNVMSTTPDFVSEQFIKSVFTARAQAKLKLGDYKGALDDFLRGEDNFLDLLPISILYLKVGNARYAMNYCNDILERSPDAIIGYACIANIYQEKGLYDSAIKVWDYAIARKKTNAIAYVERANLKKMIADINGYENDISMAKQYSPFIKTSTSLIDDFLSKRKVQLKTLKY